MLSTQTLHRQTSALVIGAPVGARRRVASAPWSAAAGYRSETGSRGAGITVVPFADKKFANNNKIRPLSPKRRRTG